MNKLILALDPGRDKIGIAVVDEELKVYTREIIPEKEIISYLSTLVHKYNIKEIVLGDGTTSEGMKNKLESQFEDSYPVQTIDESYTTIEAEKRYRQENPLQGLKKLFKFINWKPKVPVDDYVAVILAERYFKRDDKISRK